jgi:hypothetical protein
MLGPMKPAALFGLVALAVAMGALVFGRLIMLPGLGQHPELIDANFAKTLAEPLHLRLAEVVLAAHLVVAALARPWLGTRWGTTLGLLLVGGSAAQRFIILPALYSAWSHADLVAGRPVDYILQAQTYDFIELLVVAGMGLLQLGLIGIHVFGEPAQQERDEPSTIATPTPVASAA